MLDLIGISICSSHGVYRHATDNLEANMARILGIPTNNARTFQPNRRENSKSAPSASWPDGAAMSP